MVSPNCFTLIAAVVFGTLCPSAGAQLTPDRAYYGIGRSIPMTVRVPDDLKGEAEIRLLAPVTADTKSAAAVVAGKVDMAGLFPVLWKPPVPPVQETVYYAQLVVGEQKIGLRRASCARAEGVVNGCVHGLPR